MVAEQRDAAGTREAEGRRRKRRGQGQGKDPTPKALPNEPGNGIVDKPDAKRRKKSEPEDARVAGGNEEHGGGPEKEGLEGEERSGGMRKEKLKEDPVTKELKLRARKYVRGSGIKLGAEVDLKLLNRLKRKEEVYSEAALNAAKAEQWLLPSEGGYLEVEGAETTLSIAQSAIVKELDISSATNAFDLRLPELGPYCLDYSRNSKHFLIGGKLGHLAMVEWRKCRIVTEFHVREKIYDVKFLHSDVFFAAAQAKHVFIYDKRGIELHCLKTLCNATKLDFLPYHFLLASVGKQGVLTYTDTSTGEMPAQHKTKLGRCNTMAVNPQNAIVLLGHNNGIVTFWSPNMSTPLVRMLCHRGPVNNLGVDSTGTYLVTTGLDKQMKVYDIRKLDGNPVMQYFTPMPVSSLDLSQKGLLAIGNGSGIQVWKDAFTAKQIFPYMRHRVFDSAVVESLKFCPYEDVLGVGHAKGFSSLIIPGSGEPNFDTFVANPFETKKQRREGEVHSLLDKLQPDTIVLDPQKIGSVLKTAYDADKSKYEAMEDGIKRWNKTRVKVLEDGTVVEKKRTKGRGKTGMQFRAKQMNSERKKRPFLAAKMMEERKEKLKIEKEKLKVEKEKEKRKSQTSVGREADQSVPSALDRFKKRSS